MKHLSLFVMGLLVGSSMYGAPIQSEAFKALPVHEQNKIQHLALPQAQEAYARLPQEHRQALAVESSGSRIRDHREHMTEAEQVAHDAYRQKLQEVVQEQHMGGFAFQDEHVAAQAHQEQLVVAHEHELQNTVSDSKMFVPKKSLWQQFKDVLNRWLVKVDNVLQAQEQLHRLEDQIKKYEAHNEQIAHALANLPQFVDVMQKDLDLLKNEKELDGLDRQTRRKRDLINALAQEYMQTREYMEMKLKPVTGESQVQYDVIQKLDETLKTVFGGVLTDAQQQKLSSESDQNHVTMQAELGTHNASDRSSVVDQFDTGTESKAFSPIRREFPPVRPAQAESAFAPRSLQDILNEFEKMVETASKDEIRAAYNAAQKEMKSHLFSDSSAQQDRLKELTQAYQAKLQEYAKSGQNIFAASVVDPRARKAAPLHSDL